MHGGILSKCGFETSVVFFSTFVWWPIMGVPGTFLLLCILLILRQSTSAGSPVRLVNSDNRCSGRVEVYHDAQWGTVCDDGWDLMDADVVCRQLGCGAARSALTNAAQGQGSGPIWLDDVSCSGNESSITDCRHPGFGVHNCQHAEDAGVICEFLPTSPEPTTAHFTTTEAPPIITSTPAAGNSTADEGEVRLADGGNSSCSGRVEIFHSGQWGAVCDDHWDLLDAQVVCRQLGCGRVLSAPQAAHFGQGTGPIWLDDLVCGGSESKLSECSHRGFGTHDCGHHEDAGVACEAGSPVRLVNSDNRCSGRVEVYHDAQWGTVCDDGWDLMDADVVCRQLGCGAARSAVVSTAFGQGSGPIWLDHVSCSGNESSISDCRHPGFGVHNCQHGEDAGVICDSNFTTTEAPPIITSTPAAGNSTAVEGEVRLADGGNSSCSGRVEIFHSGQWGAVCDDHWDLMDAEVVCRQLGCGRVLSAPQVAHFGQGTGPIWLDDVFCRGSESKLSDCVHIGFGTHDCHHGEDAGVVCEAGSPVRLVNSDNRCSGRVEVYHDAQWGTVCDDGWDLMDADVVCRQLGCGAARSALTNAAQGQGSGPIWLDDVSCSGNESSITDCRQPGFGVHNCQHAEDAGVICGFSPTSPEPTTAHFTTTEAPPIITGATSAINSTAVEGEVRLTDGGDSSCSGRVEIFHSGQWGAVCDDHWDLMDAEVVCRQLGCGRVLSAPQVGHFGQGTGPIWLDDVFCRGSESKLSDCVHIGFGTHDCHHGEDAGVVCEVFPTPPEPTTAHFTTTEAPPIITSTPAAGNSTAVEGEVRLADGGNSSCSGRVEIFHSGQWGAVCDDHWDLLDAQVVCRQLGCGRVLSAPQAAHFGQGTGPIWLDDLVCRGSESKLSECSHRGFGTHDCGHHEDAGVVCEAGSPVRLVNSDNRCSGRVEVYHDAQWGTVCDDAWDLMDADVVCRQLGCGAARSALTNAAQGQGSGPIWLDDVSCSGNESSITDCRHPGFRVHNCQHAEDAGVICE
uniref:deleted in malignant brain tumors 1 protein isoform X3 n=1 Tax=Gasterosteus aculeatus aculeatus TaxID=481459 RepID=UPI001A97E16F|nr:deleted in malignant brain tumors 1 protein isoform X3 [Gasterosteus aculeatus aculeatus]